MLTIERSLNVYAAGIPQIINISQYDDDFQLVFALYTSEGTFTVPSGTTAEIMGTKVDGNGYSADATISGNTVTVTGNNQMTACAGRNIFEIVLTKSGKRLATINFILQVERAALDADTIQSETVLRELNAIIDGADRAEDAAERAEEAEAVVTESLDQKAPVIINASDEAEVVTFSDGADGMPLKSMTFDFADSQSGYTSVNVMRAGKNLLNVTATSRTYNGITMTVNEDGTITANGTATATAAFYLCDLTDAFSEGTYVLNGCPSGGTAGGYDLRMYQGSSGFAYDKGDGATFIGRSNVRVGLVINNGKTVNNLTFKPMIRLASISDPTYEPYQSNTYPITLPQTVYGGKITINNPGVTTLLGANTIWMDADGTIQCEYPADTKLYIDALTAPDEDMIANANIQSGKYFTVNNKLYISTSAIAQGEQIVVGTNCTQTDLATALNALNA